MAELRTYRTDLEAVLALTSALILELAVQGIVDLDRVREIAVVEAFRLTVGRADAPELWGQLVLPFEADIDDVWGEELRPDAQADGRCVRGVDASWLSAGVSDP